MPVNELPDNSDEKEKPKKRSWFKAVIILLVLFIFIGILTGTAWWLFLSSDAIFKHLLDGSSNIEKTQTHNNNSTKKDGEKDSSVALSPKPILKPISLPPITVNLADPSGNKYLRMGMDVELNSQEAITSLLAQSARVRDAIILLLSSKTSDELTSAEGKVLLKNEVASRLNQILGEPKVVRIYFTDFVIQ